MNFDADLVLKYADFIMTIGVGVYVFFATRRHDVDALFKEGSKKFTALELRVELLEQAVAALPNKDSLHDMQLEMVRQTGSLNEMRAVMEGNAKIMARLESIVSRHEDHLLDGGKSR